MERVRQVHHREPDCLICNMEDAPDEHVVFRTDLWAAEVMPGFDVPGWIVLRARRHAERLTGLNNEELATLGENARNLVGAVSDVMHAPATYLLVFGESYPHFHALVAPRHDGVAPKYRAGNILELTATETDLGASAALVPEIREAYERVVATAAAIPAVR